VPDLNHLWQRFLLASSLLVGLAIGAAVTVFGYSNLGSVNVRWSVLHIDGVPLWTVAVVPLALFLVAGTLYHWMDGLHHFTEHMRHRRRVHELEAEVASLREHLDQVLEMPDHSTSKLPAKRAVATSLPDADEAMSEAHRSDEPDVAPIKTEPAEIEPAAKVDGSSKAPSAAADGRPADKLPTTPRGAHRGLRRRATLSSVAVAGKEQPDRSGSHGEGTPAGGAAAEPPVSPAPEV
jgi:hypothetical protein